MEKKKTARVTAEYKNAYKVKNDDKEFFARITGKQIFDALSRENFPAVGDFVVIDELPEDQAVIREILPRKTIIKRKSIGKNGVQIIATNIDVAFIVESINRDFNLNRMERYFTIAQDGGIKSAIILNKSDLISKEGLDDKISQIKNRFPNIDIIVTSANTGNGLDELKKYIEKEKTYCFLGSSGVGKSSLINSLLGENLIRTEEISSYSDRGKHITTTRQMYFLENGGIVIDNPGMREVGMTNVNEGINNFFDKLTDLAQKCKYGDCTHTHEKNCAVLEALKNGEVYEEQYRNYLNLKKESEYYEMSEVEKREKDRDFGKFMKKAKKSFKEYRNKN